MRVWEYTYAYVRGSGFMTASVSACARVYAAYAR